MATVCVGGCLTTDTSGKLVISTGTWNHTCSNNLGATIHCSDDGVLRGEPSPVTVFDYASPAPTVTNAATAGLPLGTTLDYSTSGNRVSITNTSACLSMLVELTMGARLQVDFDHANTTPGGHVYALVGQYRINGGAYSDYQRTQWAEQDATTPATPDNSTQAGTVWPVALRPFTLAPGASAIIDTRVNVEISGVNTSVRTRISEPSIRIVGRTL